MSGYAMVVVGHSKKVTVIGSSWL